jgi:hypothetical protein
MVRSADAVVGGLSDIVKNVVAVSLPTVALTVCAPAARPGTVNVAAKAPTISVTRAVVGMTTPPPIAIEETAVCGWNPTPVTVTRVPTGPLAGLRVINGSPIENVFEGAALPYESVAATVPLGGAVTGIAKLAMMFPFASGVVTSTVWPAKVIGTIPSDPGTHPLPVTVTTVPLYPLAGEMAIVGCVTVNV